MPKINRVRTALHWACMLDKTIVVKTMINNSKSFGLDLTIKDNNNDTGF